MSNEIDLRRFNDVTYYAQLPFVASDMMRFCLGDKIGQGQFRAVYHWEHNTGMVVKFAQAVERNIAEFAVWDAVQGTHYAKWFAPVIKCSPCGHFLLMKYARPITAKDKLPKKIPTFFTDLKKSNYGMIGKQLVCLDYHFLSMAFDHAAMVSRDLIWNKDEK